MTSGPIKLFVSLRQLSSADQEYKKLTLLIDASARISELKRQIEKEFSDLFPFEPPFIVAKIDDEQGYSLSNNSKVGEFLKQGDRISALPENLGHNGPGNGASSGGNTEDLVVMLRNLQGSLVNKIA